MDQQTCGSSGHQLVALIQVPVIALEEEDVSEQTLFSASA